VIQRFSPGGSGQWQVSFVFKDIEQRAAHSGIIIHDENFCSFRHFFPSL